MKKELTECQKEALDFIKKYKNENGFSPSVREISDACAISIKSVSDRLMALEKKGYIKHVYGVARSITII